MNEEDKVKLLIMGGLGAGTIIINILSYIYLSINNAGAIVFLYLAILSLLLMIFGIGGFIVCICIDGFIEKRKKLINGD